MSVYGIVYRAFLIEDNKSYVGQTIKSFDNRINQHRCLSKNINDTRHFYNAIRKYEWNNFQWEILEECYNKVELDNAEKKWINYFDSIENGFNLKEGGSYGKHSEETKQKISEKNSGESNGMYGKVGINRGKKFTKEHSENLSISHKGQHPPNYGKKYTLTPLSNDDVLNVKKLYKEGFLIREIAKMFEKSKTTISDIVNNKSYLLTTEERLQQKIEIGKKNAGSNNGMYGKRKIKKEI